MFKRLMFCGMIGLLLAFSVTAQAQVPPVADPTVVNKVKMLLSGYEHFPPPKTWMALGDQGAKALMVLTLDETQWPLVRSRSVMALGFYPTEEVKTFLVMLDYKDRIAPMLRRNAIVSLASAFGPSAVPIIGKRLSDEDYFVREAAIKNLAKLGGEQAATLLTEQRKIEKERILRENIDVELKRIKK